MIASHFAQFGRGSAKSQVQLWLPQAQVISLDPGPRGPVVTTQPVAEAAAVWAASNQAVTWTLGAMDITGDTANVRVRATQGGAERDELIVLSRVQGVWRLAGKLSMIAPRAANGA